MPFRLKKADVLFISLVRAGANRREVFYKSAEGKDDTDLDEFLKGENAFIREFEVRKTDDLRQEITGIAYPVGSPTDTDTDDDFGTEEDVDAMREGFMSKGRTGFGVDQDHSYRALPEVFVSESWRVRKGDPVFTNPNDIGAWATTIKVKSRDKYEELKKSGYRGLSIAGTAEREEIEKSNNGGAENWLSKIRRKLGKEDDVSQKEIADLKKAVEDLTAMVSDLAKQIKGEEGNEGNGGNEEPDLAKQVAELTKQVADLAKAKETKPPEEKENKGEGDKGDGKGESELAKQVADLTKQIAELQKATPGSRQQDPGDVEKNNKALGMM